MRGSYAFTWQTAQQGPARTALMAQAGPIRHKYNISVSDLVFILDFTPLISTIRCSGFLQAS